MVLLEYGADSPQMGSVILSMVAAFLSLFMANRPVSARKTGARVVAIALLASLSVIIGGPLPLIVGLLACAAGDALLIQQDQRALPAGFACLAVGHLAFGAMLLPVLAPGQISAHPWLLLAFAAAVAAFARMIMSGGERDSGQMLFALPYVAAAFFASLLALASPREGIALGSLLLLVYAYFNVGLRPSGNRPAVLEPAGWAIFYGAQLTITLFALGLV